MFRGPAAFDGDDYFLVDNSSDGMDLFSLPDAVWIRHFPTGPRSARYPVRVAFGDHGEIVVSGSDFGYSHIFLLTNGQKICTLRHRSRKLIQCVTVGVSYLPSQCS